MIRFNQDEQRQSLSDVWLWRRIRSLKHLDLSGVGGGGLVSALTAPRAGGVDQALVPGGGQGLNCNPEGDVHQ